MPSALDTGRAQQAADAVYARLQHIGGLLAELRNQADALNRTDELKQLIEREEHWLAEARQTVIHVPRWREKEARLWWRGVATRWLVAAVFAIAAAAAAGAGYVALARPADHEINELRDEAAFGKFVEQRALQMSVAERRQFDALMLWPRVPNPKSQMKSTR